MNQIERTMLCEMYEQIRISLKQISKKIDENKKKEPLSIQRSEFIEQKQLSQIIEQLSALQNQTKALKISQEQIFKKLIEVVTGSLKATIKHNSLSKRGFIKYLLFCFAILSLLCVSFTYNLSQHKENKALKQRIELQTK